MFTRISISRSFTKSQWFSFSTAKTTQYPQGEHETQELGSPLPWIWAPVQQNSELLRHTSTTPSQPAPKRPAELGLKPSHASTGLSSRPALDLQDLCIAHLSQGSHLPTHFGTSKVMICLLTGFHFPPKPTQNPSTHRGLRRPSLNSISSYLVLVFWEQQEPRRIQVKSKTSQIHQLLS